MNVINPSCRSDTESSENDDCTYSEANFSEPVHQVEEQGDDEEEPSPELLRLVEQEERVIEPYQEKIEMVNLGSEKDKKEVKVGTAMSAAVRERLVKLLRDFKDVFAWSYQDMPGLDPEIVQHKLPLKLGCRPVKQKLRRMKPEISLKIKEEVK